MVYWDLPHGPEIPSVSGDLEGAMAEAVRHLLELGPRRILFLGHEAEFPVQNPRLLGYLSAINATGVPVDPHLIQGIPRWEDSLAAGYHRVMQVLRRGLPFTAVAAANDLLAIGAIRALRERGLSVPEDVSVTGIDDIELSSYVEPPLTTVHLPKRDIGRLLVTGLIEQIEKPESGGVRIAVRLGKRMGIRGSTGVIRNV